MTIGEDFRAWLLADPAIVAIVGDNIPQNKIPQGTDQLPAVWFRHGTSADEQTLQANPQTATQFSESFDVEAVSDDLEVTEELAMLLKSKQGTAGAFGGGKVQGVFVDDHNDSYRRKTVSDDDGRHVAALDFEIVGYRE